MFTYEPLGHREIRLLHVTRSDTAPHGLHLDLSKANLDQAPSFAALSYTWEMEPKVLSSQDSSVESEDPATAPREEQMFKVQCGNGFLEARENLFHFLQWLQTCEEPATFWIDAVCINQADLEERAKQVVLMGDVYRRASKVHIWLGQTPVSEGAMRVIVDFIPAVLSDWARRGPSGTKFYSERDMLCNDEELRLSIGHQACEIWSSHWQDFIRIFERRWFSRGWIVQEVCIRDLETCTFVAGTQEVDYKHLEDFDKFLVRTGWTQQLYRRTRDSGMANARGAMGSFSNLRDILAVLSYNHEHNRRYLEAIYGVRTEEQAWYAAYSEVISRMRWRSLKDARDIVYASLGMMTTVAPKNMPKRIKPDYHLTVTDVYAGFTSLLLQHHPFMNLLCLRDDPSDRRHQELPSWVPDFSVGLSHNPLIRSSDFYRDQHGHNYVFGRRFNASQTDAEDKGFREVHGRTLELHGTMLTTVGWCGFEDPLLAALSAAKLAAQDKAHPNTPDSMYDAVWKTLIVDDPPPSLDQQTCPEGFRHWLLSQLAQLWRDCQANLQTSSEHRSRLQEMESLLSCSQQADDSPEGRQGARGLPTTAEVMEASADSNGPSTPSNHSFHVACMVALRGRRLYTTSAGHVALGPRSLRQGDEVWLVKGVKVPLVLRRSSEAGTHSLIGESYVHGAMYGEAMTEELRAGCGPVRIT